MENIMNWYKIQMDEAKFYRLGVMAFVLAVQMTFVPVILFVISMYGGSAFAFAGVTICSFTLLVLLLGDVPVKVTIPVFIGCFLIQLAIILGTVI